MRRSKEKSKKSKAAREEEDDDEDILEEQQQLQVEEVYLSKAPRIYQEANVSKTRIPMQQQQIAHPRTKIAQRKMPYQQSTKLFAEAQNTMEELNEDYQFMNSDYQQNMTQQLSQYTHLPPLPPITITLNFRELLQPGLKTSSMQAFKVCLMIPHCTVAREHLFFLRSMFDRKLQ
jgi:hypothetical protein